MGNRKLKKEILDLLGKDDFEKALESIRRLPGRKAVNPLFSYLYHTDDLIRWHAVSAMGVVVSHLADADMESARIVMRRFLWNLNDESGGIGWGSPEAMGEIMARHGPLADEFSKLLRSYVLPHGNFLEHSMLQRGVLWGLARLARRRPIHVAEAGPFLAGFLTSADPVHRGLAILIMGAIRHRGSLPKLKTLMNDPTVIDVYEDLRLKPYSIHRLAAEAVADMR
ncbi:MAG: HEAT repeat domain-containing protein [Deltaproteobacteria bacterium]|jgi:hypothetical protein